MDLLTTPALSEELRRAQRTHSAVIVDLEKVAFMDCAGLQALVIATTAAGPGQPTSVTPGPPQVQRLFRLAHVDRALRIVDRSRPQPGNALAKPVPRWGTASSTAAGAA